MGGPSVGERPASDDAGRLADVPILAARGLIKDFPGVRALDHVNFDIAPGEIVALPIAHPLFEAAKARLLVKAGRPLGVAADTLLRCLLRDMPMFADGGRRKGQRSRKARSR